MEEADRRLVLELDNALADVDQPQHDLAERFPVLRFQRDLGRRVQTQLGRAFREGGEP